MSQAVASAVLASSFQAYVVMTLVFSRMMAIVMMHLVLVGLVHPYFIVIQEQIVQIVGEVLREEPQEEVVLSIIAVMD